MIEWLDSEPSPCGNADTVYPLDKAKARFEVRDLCRDAWLVLKWDADRLWLHFAVMTFHSSDGDGKNTVMKPQFHGEGPSQNLRECRHTWWGDNGDGYLFYPQGPAIIAGFKALSEYFDNMTQAAGQANDGEMK